jgi:hypothetical protein
VLPQSGHFGRQKSSVASTRRVDALWHADCTIIVDPPSTLAHRTQSIAGQFGGRVWRRRDTFVKLPWLCKVPQPTEQNGGICVGRPRRFHRPEVSSGAQLVRPDIRQSSNLPDA